MKQLLDDLDINQNVQQLIDSVTLFNLKQCLKMNIEDNERIKTKYERAKLPFHEYENYTANEVIIFSLKNLIRYFTIENKIEVD